MRSVHLVSRTVAGILSASAANALFVALATAAPAKSHMPSTRLKEIVVTAQRRAQNIQDVPITMEALTGKTLQQLNVQTFSDYVQYLPAVSTATVGPGQGQIFMRGLSTGGIDTQGQGAVGGFPNVAVYLDNQSAMLLGRNLDIYAVDLKRIEVLEGPQGTLFGAGAEAGVIRYITNKPVLDATQVDVNAAYGITAHGGPNTHANAVLNIPLINDKLAARIVIFTDHRGGYINNLPAVFARSGADLGIAADNGGVVPNNSTTINNYSIAANDINPLTYQGARAELLYKINDDWNVLLTQMYQNMYAQGVFYEMPNGTEGASLSSLGVPTGGQPLPPYSVNLFNPSYDNDRFESTELDVHGKVGVLSVVYSGSYLDRNVQQEQDYTNYARGRYGFYYQCTGVSYSSAYGNPNATCYSPSGVWRETERNTHLQQELRISTPKSWRLRGLAGIFYEDYKIYDLTQWMYRTVPTCSPAGLTSNCFLPIAPWPGSPYGGTRNGSVAFIDDTVRTFIQKAAYTSISYDIVPHKLTITGGIRYFDMYERELGGDVSSFGCKQFSTTTYFGPCLTATGTDFANQNPNSFVETGKRGRANLTWHVTPGVMLYYTYSQGFRPGGFNRGSSTHLPDAGGQDQYATPLTYQSDSLTNNEVGWKTLWWNDRLEIDGSVYQENWSNAQVEFFCPQCGLGNITFVTNGPDFRVRGTEWQIAVRPLRGLTIDAAAAWNSGELVNSPALIGNIPGTADYGKPLTSYYVNGVATPVADVYGVPGSPLADSPPFDANMRVRYEWVVGHYMPYVQAGVVHQAHSYSASGHVEAYNQPAWTTYNMALGVSKGRWTLSLFGSNLTDVNKSLFTYSGQFTRTETPMRPRVIELAFNYRYSSR